MESSQSGEKDPRIVVVERIAGSRHFKKASRLTHFLYYVVEREIDGRDSEISEQQIGVHVFGRPATYNPGDDNIVRSYARNLRARLEEYYRDEGKGDELVLEIPRGAYRPVFVERKHAQSTSRFADEDEVEDYRVESQRAAATKWQVAAIFGLVGMLVVAIAILGYEAGERNFGRAMLQKDHAFWGMLFNENENTLIVPGDSSLVLLEGVTHELVTPEQYERKTYDTDVMGKLGGNAALIANLAQRPYTSIVDLQAAGRLESLPEVAAERTHVRFARDLHIEDLRTENVILLGSAQANPWVQLFDARLNFHVKYQTSDGGYRILNSAPRQGELAEYPFSVQDPEHRAYALIAFEPNLAGRGYVLLIEGTSMAGTQAAMDFLFNESSMQTLLKQCKMPDGGFGSFEVLLQTMDVGSRAAGATILGERTAH